MASRNPRTHRETEGTEPGRLPLVDQPAAYLTARCNSVVGVPAVTPCRRENRGGSLADACPLTVDFRFCLATFLPCWVTHAASGLAVIPARTTRLLLRWMKNSTSSVLRRIVSTVKQVARHDPLGLRFEELRPSGPRAPWRRTQAVASQQRPDRRGTNPDAQLADLPGDSDAAPSGVLPCHPHDEAATSGSIAGLPGLRPLGEVHLDRTSMRCQRSSVWGVTRNDAQRSGGSTRLAAASTIRSSVVNRGRPVLRRSTRS